MPTIVELPGENVELEFPDEMSRTDMEREIIKKFPSQAPKGPSTRAALSAPGERIATREGTPQEGVMAGQLPTQAERVQDIQSREKAETQRQSEIFRPSEEAQKASLMGIAQPEEGWPTLPKVTSQELQTLGVPSLIAKPAAGAQQAVVEAANFFLTPEGISTLGLGAMAPAGAHAYAAAYVERMAEQAPDQFASAYQNFKAGKTEEGTKDLFGAMMTSGIIGGGIKSAFTKPTLLTQSAEELRQLERERTPDAISQRETAQVPLEVPPGDRGELGSQVREQTTPEETLARTSEDDARAEAAAANVPRDVASQAPVAPQVELAAIPADVLEAQQAWKRAEKRWRRAKRQEPSDVEDADLARMEAETNFWNIAEKSKLSQEQFDALRSDATMTETEATGEVELAATSKAGPFRPPETVNVLRELDKIDNLPTSEKGNAKLEFIQRTGQANKEFNPPTNRDDTWVSNVKFDPEGFGFGAWEVTIETPKGPVKNQVGFADGLNNPDLAAARALMMHIGAKFKGWDLANALASMGVEDKLRFKLGGDSISVSTKKVQPIKPKQIAPTPTPKIEPTATPTPALTEGRAPEAGKTAAPAQAAEKVQAEVKAEEPKPPTELYLSWSPKSGGDILGESQRSSKDVITWAKQQIEGLRQEVKDYRSEEQKNRAAYKESPNRRVMGGLAPESLRAASAKSKKLEAQAKIDFLKSRIAEHERIQKARAKPTTPAPPIAEPSVGPGAASPDPATSFSSSVKDVPVKSKVAANLAEKTAEKQNLGITALPPIGGTGLSKVGNAIKAGLRELRDIPKFTAFKETVNRWFGQNQKTSLEVRALQKDIESRVPTEARREAITNYLQADGNAALLDAWSKGTKNSKRKAGYEAAKNLTPDELKIAQAVRKLYDDYLTKAQAYDLVDTGIEDYVTQVWKRPLLGGAQFAQFASKLSPQFRFGKQRVFENFFEGEQAGFKPVTKDISKLVGLYVSEMGKTIATRDFIKDLTTKDAADGRPLAAPSGVGNAVLDKNATPSIFVRPNAKNKTLRDYSRWTHPALTGWKWVAEDPISGAPVLLKGNLVLHPDIAGHVENILSRSAIKRWYDTPSTPMGVLPKALAKGLDQWQGVTKQIMLGFFAPFHHIQEATHALGHRVNPVFDLPALNHADPNLQRAMNHGLAVAGDNAAMESFREGVGAGKIFGKIPIVGEWANQWSDFLFHEYIPRLKWKTYQDILHRNLQRYGPEIGRGEATIDDVEYLSSKQTNAAFGHQNYADLGRNPTIQHIARTLALAPDFLEARTRFFGQALKGAIGKEGREQLMAMATLAGTFWVGSRIINKLGSGDYHNEEPFGVVLGGRTYTMRSVPEDAWRAFKDTRKFIYGRVSPIIGRGTIELLTGKNYRGEKTTALETMQDLLASWVPITLRNLPGVERLSPSQVNRSVNAWESFLGAMGVQISRHSPISKGYQLGGEYMKAQGVKEDRGSYPVSKYQQLRYALEDADLEKAASEIRRLRDSEKMTSSKLHKGFHESLFHPWTKSEAMDRQFKRSLTPENKMLVNEAEEQRRRVWQRFVKARGMSFAPQP